MSNHTRTQRPRFVVDGWLGSVLLALFALLAAQGGSVGALHEGWAQTAGSPSNANPMQGEITARQGNQIRINSQTYVLHQQVIVKDEEGRPRGLADLTPGAMVTFQVKQGQISEIILVMPR